MTDSDTDTTYDDLLADAQNIKNEVIQKITGSGVFDDFVMIDVPILLEKYIKQTEQLLWRYNKLNKIISNFSMELIENTIAELTEMSEQTGDAVLKGKCDTSIQQYELHRDTLTDYITQKEKIKKRLDSTIFDLLKIKYDLQKLLNVDSNRNRLEFYKNFQNSFRYDF